MEKQYGVLNIAVAIAASLYITVILLHGQFGANLRCFSLLGCNSGFFGYDAMFEHFLCAFVGTLLLVRFMKVHPNKSFLHNLLWKNAVMLIALVMLLSVAWEFFEFSHDQIVAQISPNSTLTFLSGRRLQPNNTDTMGDLTFDFLGSIAAIIVLRFIASDLIRKV
jgi:glycerol uptake facilitator-like aquaporin